MSDEIKKAIDNAESVPAPAASELNEEELKNVTGGVAESVSFGFGKIEFKYEPQKPDGD
jgi:bacteriocin-like protein